MQKAHQKSIETHDTQHANKPNSESQVITDFGVRAIYKANCSRAVSLPKTALANLGMDTGKVSIQLVQEKHTKYLRLVPVEQRGGETN
jgi:hypothetical protein